jgi:hypothetical protein
LNDDDYKSWIDRVQVHFPSLWQNLSNVRNVDDRQSKHLIQGKKVQVLHQILTIFRQTGFAGIEVVGFDRDDGIKINELGSR